MKLWLVRRIDAGDEPSAAWWDEPRGFVIRAENEVSARQLAANEHYMEFAEIWKNPDMSTCEELTIDGDKQIILEDFCSG